MTREKVLRQQEAQEFPGAPGRLPGRQETSTLLGLVPGLEGRELISPFLSLTSRMVGV